ncbi:hypothetical protein P7K49_029510 [Saguinus oedipus]|uniref:Uncharacterized protein n=1 Tax=Saguinus oedipus TaxID=9490 RepID=A0ABQ9U7E9_SAGOE|nr:hypothetical protein P7K49_029510 [Saguinus oedipus]
MPTACPPPGGARKLATARNIPRSNSGIAPARPRSGKTYRNAHAPRTGWAGAEPEEWVEVRLRGDPAGRKPGARRRGRAAAGGGDIQAAVAAAVARPRRGPGPARLTGMVSKALLRLVSAVNRRRMKLLLGIDLLAYPHSFPGASVGRVAAVRGPGAALQPALLPAPVGPALSAPTPFHSCSKSVGQLGRTPRSLRPGLVPRAQGPLAVLGRPPREGLGGGTVVHIALGACRRHRSVPRGNTLGGTRGRAAVLVKAPPFQVFSSGLGGRAQQEGSSVAGRGVPGASLSGGPSAY